MQFRQHDSTTHGPDDEPIYPGRLVAAGNWPDEPRTCQHVGPGTWHDEGTVLLCPGCGLDCT